MKKTIIAWVALAGVSTAATDLYYWGGDGGYDLLTVSGDTTPYLTSDKANQADKAVVTSITTAGNSEYNLIFDPNQNKEGNPPAPVKTPVFTLNSAIYLNKVNVGSSAPTSITIDFGTNGSITSANEINFGQNLENITLKATLTDDQISTLSVADAVVTRNLLNAGGNYGVWNFDTAKSVTLEIVGLTGYEYKGLITSADDLTEGQYGYISTTKNGVNAAGTVQMVVKGIPEPTTATLSLLALAGLAARRRRR